MFYKKNVDFCSKSKLADKLLAGLKKLIIVCQNDFNHAKKFQKQVYNKGVKPRSYIPGNKIWFNTKYIKTKQK